LRINLITLFVAIRVIALDEFLIDFHEKDGNVTLVIGE
jgi:hypothetical protein